MTTPNWLIEMYPDEDVIAVLPAGECPICGQHTQLSFRFARFERRIDDYGDHYGENCGFACPCGWNNAGVREVARQVEGWLQYRQSAEWRQYQRDKGAKARSEGRPSGRGQSGGR